VVLSSAIATARGQALSFSTNYFNLSSYAGLVTTADLFNTHRPAVITANPLTVFANLGNGTLVSNSTLNVGSSSTCLVAGDFNNDLWADVASIGNSATVILTNNRAGTLGSNSLVNVGGNCAVACDVNGDGWLDLVIGTGTGVTVLTNNGAGRLGVNASTVIPGGALYLAAADLNGDGSVDLVAANNTIQTLTILTNTGTGTMVAGTSTALASVGSRMTTADVNGDGYPDVVLPGGGSTILVYTNNGSGVLGLNATLAVNRTPTQVLAADMHGGGLPDIVGLDGADNPGLLQVFTNNNGSFGSYIAVHGTFESGAMALADMNGDGKMDVVSVNTGSTIGVILNNTIYASPPLNVVSSGGQEVLYWKGPAPNSVLQATTNIITPNWKTVTTGVPINGVAVPNQGPNMFFRLISQ
jgi:hypothetical protein